MRKLLNIISCEDCHHMQISKTKNCYYCDYEPGPGDTMPITNYTVVADFCPLPIFDDDDYKKK